MLICEKELAKAAYLARTSLTPSKLSLVSSFSHGSNDDERRVEGRAEAYKKYNQTNSCCDSQERWLVSPFVPHPQPPFPAALVSLIPNGTHSHTIAAIGGGTAS